MEKVMQAYQEGSVASKRLLEVNLEHPLLVKLADIQKDEARQSLFENVTYLLYEQARLMEGDLPEDLSEFTTKMNDLLLKL
ncbi:MAG: hypothetical protein CMP22_04535, partial [Rickettsiales bacterium]|nr:hypothetical protein [Rickettsiales bacterium]